MILSVITIAYNNLSGLEKTLQVFKERDFNRDIEIVLVDGNSKDGTKEFLAEQTLTKNWVSEKDKGIYNAMNKGLSMANGEYVWFLNSGDYVLNSGVIEDVLVALEEKPDAVYGETMMVDPSGKHIGTRSEISTRKLPSKLNWKSFSMGMNVGHQSFILKRSLAVFYNEDYHYVADIDWMISCLKQCKTVVGLDRVIACFTLEGFSAENRKKSNMERFKVLKKHYGMFPNLYAHMRIAARKIFNQGKI